VAMAKAAYAAGNLSGAVAAYREAIKGAEASTDPALLSTAHDNLGLALADLGRFDDALRQHDEALRYETDPRKRSLILSNKAGALGQIGELTLSARIFEQRLAESERAEGSPDLPVALDNAASAYARLGDYAKALSVLERASALFAPGDLQGRAINAQSLSNAHAIRGDLDAAGRYFQEAHELALAHARSTIAVEHYRRGFLASQRGRLSMQHPVYSLFGQGAARLNAGAMQETLKIWGQAATMARNEGDIAFALRIDANAAAILSDAGQVAPAIEIILRVRDEAGTRGLARPELMVTSTLASVLMRGGEIRERLGPVGALTRSEALFDVHRRIIARGKLPPKIAAWETENTGANTALTAKLAYERHANALAIAYWRKALSIARSNAAILQGRKRRGTPAPVSFQVVNRLVGLLFAARKAGDAGTAAASATELSAFLDRGGLPPRALIAVNRALGDYYADEDRQRAIHHFDQVRVLGEETRRQVALGTGRSEVARDFADIYPKLSKMLREKGDAVAAFEVLQHAKARRLLEALAARAGDPALDDPPRIDEVTRLLGGLRVDVPTVLVDIAIESGGLTAYIVDCGSVRIARVEGDLEPGARANQRDLAAQPRRIVSYCLEDKLLARFASSVTAEISRPCRLLVSPDGFLNNVPLHIIPVDGRPWCEHFPISYIPAVGALRRSKSDARLDGLVTAVGDSRRDLPRAAAECASIAALFSTQALIGAACTPAAIIERLKSGKHLALHLAVHGRGDSRHGQRASVLLASEQGGTEWADLRTLFSSVPGIRLVVLSGCSTGVTGPLHGFELVGVARNAAEAGASAILACLWPVADAVAEQFMTEFYRVFSAQVPAGTIDLVSAFEAARTMLRRSEEPNASTGPRRDGRDLALTPGDIDTQAPIHDPSSTLRWAPFVLLGSPRL